MVHCTDMLGTFAIFPRCSLTYASPNNRNLTYQKGAMFLKFLAAGRAFLKTSACEAGAASEQFQPHGRCCGVSLENPRVLALDIINPLINPTVLLREQDASQTPA